MVSNNSKFFKTLTCIIALSCVALAAPCDAREDCAGLPICEAFQDKKLLPVGIDDNHLACWTWPAKLEETMSGRPTAFNECGESDWPGFRPNSCGEPAISFHWIWAGRRMYDAVDSDSEEARRALAEWDAALEPPLLYYHIDRRTGDESWTPIDFALSRDGRWMLCRELDDSSFRPATGTWNGWLLLAIPQWRRTRIQRLFLELAGMEGGVRAIVCRFSDATASNRHNVEIKMDCGSPIDSGFATYTVTDEKRAVVCQFRVPINFYEVKQAIRRNRFRLLPKSNDCRVGATNESIDIISENGETLVSGHLETDVVKWMGGVPCMKTVEDVLEHVLPFSVHEVRQMTLSKEP